jgi:hypothetical protein
MAYGSEGGENVKIKHKKPVFVLKIKVCVYIYISVMFLHFKNHL